MGIECRQRAAVRADHLVLAIVAVVFLTMKFIFF
jgi:hypothetical protein